MSQIHSKASSKSHPFNGNKEARAGDRPLANVDKSLEQIRALADKAIASEEFHRWTVHQLESPYPVDDQIAEAVETAFLQLLLLCEVLNIEMLHSIVAATYLRAKEIGLDRQESFEEEFVWSTWSTPIKQFADTIGAVYGSEMPAGSHTLVDLPELLRATQTAITDRLCFAPPTNEKEVHDRIETILRCVYPDLRRKPPLSKPITNFVADTAIPQLDILIEYKYLSAVENASQIANEILADVGGYNDPKWKNIIFVIYETKRFRSEAEWRHLLRESGFDARVDIVVLHGEEPRLAV